MLITVSEKDIYRFKVLSDVREKRLRQINAAILNVSVRHIRRLLNRLSTLGSQNLAHAGRGRPSNQRYSEDSKVEILKIIHKYYSDFSPTLALEKLSEQHNIAVSKETLRQ
ncbi:transposase [Vibrio sagamiensis]|uniref:Transposase n=1 Tax=Vibrio sagamiensis NBRC 104589 TaxID=1219064 RepID=A0A511QK31_9VIBR|nr:transposase [Vibrio sagamiensis]GEM77690.1 hypothetical protein VSA01S_38020 [Vibrio sagamiensis NBRC 104589]